MTAPRVSIVIPAYAAAAVLPRAIDSALSQDGGVEVVVVDDGSRDDTSGVLEKRYGTAIVRRRHDVNQGPAAARNTGIEAARGAFLLFLDADDVLTPDCVARRLAVLDTRPELGWMFSDLFLTDADGRVTRRCSVEYDYARRLRRPIFPELLRGTFIPVHAALVRRACVEAVGGFDETLRRGSEEWVFWVQLAHRFPTMYLDVPLGDYRRGPGTKTTDRYATAVGGVEAMTRLEALFPEEIAEDRPVWRRQKAEQCLRAALARGAHGRRERLRWVLHAVTTRPVQGAAYRVLLRTLWAGSPTRPGSLSP